MVDLVVGDEGPRTVGGVDDVLALTNIRGPRCVRLTPAVVSIGLPWAKEDRVYPGHHLQTPPKK